MYGEIVTQKTDYPIQPCHINLEKRPNPAFGNNGPKAWLAMQIVYLCRQRGGWWPFVKKDFTDFTKGCVSEEAFDEFVQERLIVVGHGGKHFITHLFILRCFTASPDVYFESCG